jgi:hypothetical protein
MATDFIKTQFAGRMYPSQFLGGLGNALYLTANQTFLRTFKAGIAVAASTNLNKLLNYTNAARYVSAGTVQQQYILTAGPDLPGLLGENMSVTVTGNAGSLTIAQVGVDFSIHGAAAGTTAAAFVTAFNAQVPSTFCTAALPPGAAGGTNISPNQTIRFFVSDQRTP